MLLFSFNQSGILGFLAFICAECCPLFFLCFFFYIFFFLYKRRRTSPVNCKTLSFSLCLLFFVLAFCDTKKKIIFANVGVSQTLELFPISLSLSLSLCCLSAMSRRIFCQTQPSNRRGRRRLRTRPSTHPFQKCYLYVYIACVLFQCMCLCVRVCLLTGDLLTLHTCPCVLE